MGSAFVRRLTSIPTPVIFLASIVVAVLLLWQQDTLDEIGPALRKANYWQIAVGFALYLAGLVVLCARWHVLAKMIRGTSDALQASEAFVTSVAVNYAAPLSLALPSRAYLTMRALGMKPSETAALTFWEVAADLFLLGILTAIWILVGGWRGEGITVDQSHLVLAIILLGLAVVTTIVAFATVRRLRRLMDTLYIQLRSGLSYPARRRRFAAVAIGLTAVFWLIQAGVLWILLEAIDGESPEPILVLGLVSLPILVGMLSPIPGGAGIREALMIAVAGIHGASEASVLLASVTYRIALFAALPAAFAAIRFLLRLYPPKHGTIPDEPKTTAGSANSEGT